MNPLVDRQLVLGSARFDALSGELLLDGRSTTLRPRTAALLAHLVRNAGRLVTKDELMEAVWPDAVVTEDSIVQCVKEIRHALGAAGHDWIRTFPRHGYAVVVAPARRAAQAPADSPSATPPIAKVATEPRASASATDDPGADRAAAPRRSWHAAASLVVVVATAGLLWHVWSPAPGEPPAIVVMPIANLTGNPAHEFAADDLTETLATALAHEPGMRVIAPGTAFTFKGRAVDVRQLGSELGVRYVIEGVLRASAGVAVLSLRLSEARSARQIWSDDFAVGDGIDLLNDEVREHVVRGLSLRVANAAARRWPAGQHYDPVVVEQLARARAILRWSGRDQDMVARAQALLEDVLRRDDRVAQAWTLLVKTRLHDVRFSPGREDDLRRADEASARALSLEPDSAEAQLMRAWVLYETGRMPEALATFDRGLRLAPNEPRLLAGRGAALAMLGRADEAIESIDRAMRLSPRDPVIADWQLHRGVALLHKGEAAQAAVWLGRAAEANPASPFAHLFLASALASVGAAEPAREQLAQFQRLRPGFTLGEFRAREPSDAPAFRQQRERVYRGLLLAGMPE